MKKLVSPRLTGIQSSTSTALLLLYQKIFVMYRVEGSETISAHGGDLFRKDCKLRNYSSNLSNKVAMIFQERKDEGVVVETKFAFSTWHPLISLVSEDFWDSYPFEIVCKLESKGWTHGEGNRFVETLSFRTRENYHLAIDHPMTDYIARALTELTKLLEERSFVRQEFIDHATHHSSY